MIFTYIISIIWLFILYELKKVSYTIYYYSVSDKNYIKLPIWSYIIIFILFTIPIFNVGMCMLLSILYGIHEPRIDYDKDTKFCKILKFLNKTL